MTGTPTSKRSLDRIAPLWAVLCLSAGGFSCYLLAPHMSAQAGETWRTFAGVLASVGATMTGFLAAVTAVFYAVYQAPLMRALHRSGHDRRILFHLFAGMAFWLASLLAALVACLPSDALPARGLCLAGIGFAIAGVLSFGPIGFSFWLILLNVHDEGKQPSTHDWDRPTRLD